VAVLAGSSKGDIAGAGDARRAMGATRRLSERVSLAAMRPHGDLASTRYCLADPKGEYLVYLPEGGEATVDLTAAPGRFAAEWIHSRSGASTDAGAVEGGARRSFRAPEKGDWVLHLRRKSGNQASRTPQPK
jgi:hypothetical protein